MGAIIFFIIVFAVVLPRLRQESAGRRRNFTDSGAQYYPPRAQRGRRQAAQYSYPAEGAGRPGAGYASPRRTPAQDDSVPNTDAPGAQTGRKLRQKQTLGLLAGIGGAALLGLMGVAALGNLGEILWCVANGFSFFDELALELIYVFIGFGGWKISQAGFRLMNRIKRFRLYDVIIGPRKVCPVSDIARASGREQGAVARDLQDMVRRGYFPLGFVDEQTASFYADNETWRAHNPERARAQDAPLGGTPAAAEQKESVEQAAHGAFGDEYLKALTAQMEHIEDEDIRGKVARLCESARDISAWVALHPECADDARRFCNYYMPTALKLLASYNDIAPHADESSVAAGVEGEVSRVLDTMSQAFRGLLDNLLQNTAVDMQAEISALETVLAQEGLVEQELPRPR